MGYRALSRVPLFIILIFSFLISKGAKSEPQEILDDLLKRAGEKQLYNDRMWHVLLHYKPNGSGFKSLIDDPQFFLSPDGKNNPKSELESMLTALFKSERKDDTHPRCRFPARYEWLKEQLNIDEKFFSDVKCNEFNEIYNRIQPTSVVLIFPAAYMNNPSSMFGHTLLRIDGSYESKLLSHAVNYSAHVVSAGILYPIKGIFGFYKGYFQVFPYYDMIKNYNDTEQRDMWEYTLNFSKDEVRKMFLHLWELKDIYSYYYFFDENCSYNLLFLLESARPSLNLTERFQLWAIPVDTVRAVLDTGLVSDVVYRPAMATRIRHIASLLSKKEQKLALKVAKNKLNPGEIPEEYDLKKADILNLAIEVIQYRYNKGFINRDDYLKLFISTLKERSKLVDTETDHYKIPMPVKPEDSHFSNMVSFGVRNKKNTTFMELSYRPAYHTLIDPAEGFTEGSEIVFLNTSIRGYFDGRVWLDRLDIIDIVSLSTRDMFFSPLSWKIKTGFIRKNYYEGEQLVYQLNPGFGFSYTNKITGLCYVLGEADLNLGGKYKDNYAVGTGLEIGTIKRITKFWKINIYGEALFYGMRERFEEYKTSAIQTFRLSQNNSINLSIMWEKTFRIEQVDMKINWNYYF